MVGLAQGMSGMVLCHQKKSFQKGMLRNSLLMTVDFCMYRRGVGVK